MFKYLSVELYPSSIQAFTIEDVRGHAINTDLWDPRVIRSVRRSWDIASVHLEYALITTSCRKRRGDERRERTEISLDEIISVYYWVIRESRFLHELLISWVVPSGKTEHLICILQVEHSGTRFGIEDETHSYMRRIEIRSSRIGDIKINRHVYVEGCIAWENTLNDNLLFRGIVVFDGRGRLEQVAALSEKTLYVTSGGATPD